MKKKNLVWIVIVAVVLLGALLRLVQVRFDSGGEGRAAKSPDKKFLARASSLTNKKFFGGRHNYYEFTVFSADGRRIQHITMEEPPQGMITWREGGSIEWAADGSSVTYSFKDSELKLGVIP